MKKLIASAFVLLLGAVPFAQHNHELCEGIVPENDMYIPVFQTMGAFQTGVSEADFNAVIDRAEEVYGPIIEEMGATLKVNRKWSDGTVNANASRQGSTWLVNMYGGLARHEATTVDGFAMVLCHEIGHQIGGAPKYSGWFNTWASNEGQSDYFASLKCMRKVFKDADNLAYVENKSNEINPFYVSRCDDNFKTKTQQALCIRTAMAGQSLANLFGALGQTDPPNPETPDSGEVTRTNDRHPAAQCRLDTYWQGSLCDLDHNEDVSQSDETVGTCMDDRMQGTRPRCWFKSSSSSFLELALDL